ncbi:Sporulation inhibitor A [Evansella caseinilytica]|uniref:Sporulation inhibitor A n=1 Tax=Evansella caseinilytica TaxID=1503961 RepID=A0A1H3PDR9_9BACI|nr:sporulation histidine kinase inhibitor Sda [Evansella caseinilytica]SDY99221.1 Sporulation inhibitor A [Evansella caseinilytica]
MDRLSDEMLMEVYREAKKYKVSEDFVYLVVQEIKKRELNIQELSPTVIYS